MSKRINFEIKNKLVELAGSCFWFWNSFYSFLDSCGVKRAIYTLYDKDNGKYSVMRSILERLEANSDLDTINSIISNFYKMQNACDKDNLDNEKARILLKEFKDIVGHDPIDEQIRKNNEQEYRKKQEQNIANKLSFEKYLKDLNEKFMNLYTSIELTPQQKGYELEKLFFELLRINEFEYSTPYKTSGEQIDGHFIYEKFHYLVELKWTKDPSKQVDLSIFDGKIKGKAQSTRGFFVSMNGFDDNSIMKFSGDNPRIILMSGEDLVYILNGTFGLYDALKIKVDAIVREGKIFYPLRNAI